ncbi:MAG TPA: hypothetical protein VE861_03695, partial [Gemmatimonadaceae bacterium]|nr:hypothetical protein [Gemmatimonadaceae bacterium]
MAGRIANPRWFRADGAVVSSSSLVGERLKQLQQIDRAWAETLQRERAMAARRPTEVQLRWACSDVLGVPFGPFTVWMRSPRDAVMPVDFRSGRDGQSLVLRWGVAAAIIEVECTVIDAARAVGAFATRTSGHLRETVGATAVRGAAGTRVTLRVRCSGATRLSLVNGSAPVLRVQFLTDVVNDGAWKPVELVGLPTASTWAGTAYDTSDQGLVGALVSPEAAAMQRLDRAAPFIGWFPITENARIAPAWRAPDHGTLLKEVTRDLLPRIARLYRPGMIPPQQGALRDAPTVESPQSGGRTSSLTARASLPPFALLALPATGDPFLALATGFGTGYPLESASPRLVNVSGRRDFLVTARYEALPDGRPGAEMAAFVPAPEPHG